MIRKILDQFGNTYAKQKYSKMYLNALPDKFNIDKREFNVSHGILSAIPQQAIYADITERCPLAITHGIES